MSSVQFSSRTAVAIVIANMIGTGVFTSLGFQLADIQSPFVLLALWVVGGAIALCGALCYAELGAAMPQSGGEYQFLSQLYHPAAGFVSGWISATVGFAAPTALAAITFGVYLTSVFSQVPPVASATLLVLLVGLIHGFNRGASGRFQQIMTLLKLVLIMAFCLLALGLVPSWQPVSFVPAATDVQLLTGSAFAVSLVYVNYAYTGWNAATYISGELKEPQKNLPRVLMVGTLVVTGLYVLLNAVFLLVAPMSTMSGELEIGFIASQAAFGEQGARLMGLVFAALLISTVSAMILAGPRVISAIGTDFRGLRALALRNRAGVPVTAVGLQVGLTLIMIWSSTFQSILLFTGFVLALNTFFAVLGVFVLRARQKSALFRVPWFPLPPLIYLGLTAWTMVFIQQTHPQEVFWAMGLVGAGLLLFLLTTRFSRNP